MPISNNRKLLAGKAAKSKPVKAAKTVAAPAPATDAKQAAASATADKRLADRNTVATVYNGASLTVHGKRAGKRGDYIARCQHPVQRMRDGNPSERDTSLLALIARNADKAGAFDPVAIAADIGVISRLASGGFVAYDAKADTFRATADALSRGTAASKRATA